MHNICEWPPSRCVVIAPRHETEAWILSDPAAVTGALGYSGLYSEVGLPSNAQQAERLPDPKSVLMSAVTQVRGRRKQVYPEQIYPAIAQRQSLAMLRQSESFMAFENNLREALRDLGTIRT